VIATAAANNHPLASHAKPPDSGNLPAVWRFPFSHHLKWFCTSTFPAMPIFPPPQPAVAPGRVASDRSDQDDSTARFAHGRWLSLRQTTVTDWQEVKFDVVVSHRSKVEKSAPEQLQLHLAVTE
jgi:hypothetical protein